jgi:hypothetical protein
MSYSYGDSSRKGDVGMVGTLEAVGMVAATAAQHVLLLVGTSNRGPTTLTGLSSAISAKAYFQSGKLKEAIENSFGEGAPLVYAKRVMGSENGTAKIAIGDGLDTENIVVDVSAKSPGAWGNALTVKHYKNSITHVEVGNYVGNGTVGPYVMEHANLFHKVAGDTNWLQVNGIEKTIVYDVDNLGAGKVFVDEENGAQTYFSGEEPDEHDKVEYSIEFYSMDVEISDAEFTEWKTDIYDLIGYVAALNSSVLVTAVARVGETHLPKAGTLTVPLIFGLVGGDDGIDITTEDWELALNQAGAELLTRQIVPTCVGLTDGEVQVNSNDLYSIASGWVMSMNIKWAPTIIFVPTRENETTDAVVELSKRFENRHMCIVYPAWDESSPRKNLACCCAAREAAVNLGESCAKKENRLKTAYGLMGDLNDTIDSDMVVTLNRRGIYVLEKTDAGVGPHMGVTTDTTDQFKRTVDQRTANAIIVDTNNVAVKYFFEQNTKEVRQWLNQSLQGFLATYKAKNRIYDYVTSVLPDSIDPNMIYILLKFIPMGHIEWIDTTFRMGVYRDLVELQENSR